MLVRGIDYYELLGVARDASPSEIRSAYRSLAKAMHPDRGGTAGAFRLLRDAYETLIDPDLRDEYDRGDNPDEDPDEYDDQADWDDTTTEESPGTTSYDRGATDQHDGTTHQARGQRDDTGTTDQTRGTAGQRDGTDTTGQRDSRGAAGQRGSTGQRDSRGATGQRGSTDQRGTADQRFERPRGPNRSRSRAETPHEPTVPIIEPGTIPWWDEVRKDRHVTLVPRTGPTQATTLGTAGGAAAVVLLLALVGAPAWLVILFLLAGGAAAVEIGRRHLAAQRIDREFSTEFGDRVVFGHPGQEPDELAERLTADLLARYLTRIPGVRICHGLAAEEGSVFADLDHAVLCGHRLVLIESKLWLPGHYEVDDAGDILRNGHRFRGGVVRLPERLAVYRALLPDVEVRGVLLIYPSRAGDITVGDGPGHTPERFVREIGGWLALEPSTVDRKTFRALLRQVTTTR